MIVNCPKCRGTGFLSLQKESFMEPNCDMCLGSSIVDTDHSCPCGRPAVRKVEEKEICGAQHCEDVDKGKVSQFLHGNFVC